MAARAVGVVIDTYHLWWDDQVWSQLRRAGREVLDAALAGYRTHVA